MVPGRRVDEHALGPTIALTSEDLPTLGRPIDGQVDRAVRRRHAPRSRGARSRTISSISATPRPCSAETGTGSPKPSR